MSEVFLKLFNMSISASWIVLAVLLLRIVLKKAPKWVNCILWGIVALRLVMPFSLESIFSLIPSTEFVPSEMITSNSSVNVSGTEIFDYIGNNPVSYELGINNNGQLVFNEIMGIDGAYVNPLLIITYIAAIVWSVGVVALLFYTLISYLRLKSKIGTAVLLCDNIYQSENVVSPFVLGIIKPKIYLPFNMSEDNMQNVIAHEQAHINRKDYLWKPLGFLLLAVYWFNPVMWLAYILLCRDIELACDEKVIKDFDNEQKADYSQALLACSVNRRIIAACPIAFGEVGVKGRVKSVLNYKKPAFWIIIVAVIASIVVAVCFLTNPKDNTSLFGSKYETGKCYYSYVVSKDKETEINNLSFAINASGGVYKNFGDGTGEYIGELKESTFTKSDLNKLLKAQDGKRIYFGQVEVAYEIVNDNNTKDYVFLQLKNGDVWLVSFFSNGEIMSVFKLDLVKSTSANDSNTESEILNGYYQISNEVYFNGAYSYSPNHENERIQIEFNVDKDAIHVYHFIGEVLSTGGRYTEVKPDEENFEKRISNVNGWSDYKNTKEFLKDNKKAWNLYVTDCITTYPYMLFLQKDGSLYVAFADLGRDELPDSIRDICRLEYVSAEYENQTSENTTTHSDDTVLETDYVLRIVENNSIEKIGLVTDARFYQKYGYNVYTYCLDECYVAKGGVEYSLGEAISYGIVTVENIFNKAKDDAKAGLAESDLYKDGGSVEITYDDGGTAEYHTAGYTIIKKNTLDGNKDVYIGPKDMTLNKLNDYLENGGSGLFEPQNGVHADISLETGEPRLTGIVEKINGNTILIKADAGQKGITEDSLVSFSLSTLLSHASEVPSLKIGDMVTVIYDGNIMETYPAQIRACAIYVIKSD